MGYDDSKHLLLIQRYVIPGISGAIVWLHVWEGKLLRHLCEGDSVDEW